jgi:hypothetical protein
MKKAKRPGVAKAAAKAPARQAATTLPEPEAEEIQRDEPKRRVIERPDGFYWQAVNGSEESGPFDTLAEAEADLLSGGSAELGEGETLQEAESELGISDWIDPDTGGPAEDSVPHIEDH